MNTLEIDAIASRFIELESVDGLRKAIGFSIEKKIDWLVVGGGSNICFVNEEVNKLVIRIKILGVEVLEDMIISGAGEEWDSFVVRAMKCNVSHIENLSGIPGTVGASPIHTIGAYGVEVKDMVEWVEVYNTEKDSIEKLCVNDCKFAYRDSIFKRLEGQKYIIIRVAFKRSRDPSVFIGYKDLSGYFKNKKPNKEEVRQAVIKIRSGKFPDLSIYGTAGSFFKNPVVSISKYKKLQNRYPGIPFYDVSETQRKIPLAWILDKVCDLKGYRVGNIWLHDKQPLILVTNKKATSKEIKVFSEKIKDIIFNKTKIKIENEVAFKE